MEITSKSSEDEMMELEDSIAEDLIDDLTNEQVEDFRRAFKKVMKKYRIIPKLSTGRISVE